MVGLSSPGPCGVREYTDRLSDVWASEQWEVNSSWLVCDKPTLRMVLRWLRKTARAVQNQQPDVVLCHYSSFSFGSRGFPWIAPLMAMAAAWWRRPVLLIGHELAPGWRGRGWRGVAQAVVQRVALLFLIQVSSAVVVAVEDRRLWLQSRWWLPRRPVEAVPCMEAPSVVAPWVVRPQSDVQRIGVFGFTGDSAMAGVVTQAVAELARDGRSLVLEMIGFPGRGSPQGRAWSAAAKGARCPIHFGGVMDSVSLSNALVSVDVAVFPDPRGPTSRRTTLASLLAHGVPTIAFKGADTWDQLEAKKAVHLAEGLGDLTERLRSLLTDEFERSSLGARGLEFHRRCMSPAVVASQVARVAESVRKTGLSHPYHSESSGLGRLLAVSHACALAVNQSTFVEMARLGWDVTIVVPHIWRHEYSPEPVYAQSRRSSRFKVTPVKVLFAGNIQGHVYLGPVRKLISALKPDIVFIEEECFSVPAGQWSRAAQNAGIPFGLQAAENLDRRFFWLPRLIRTAVLRHASFVAARSPAAAALAERWGATGRVGVVPHAVPALPVAEDVQHEPRNVFTIGFAGRLVPEKGLWDLVESVRRLEGPVRLLFVGDGPMRQELSEVTLPNGIVEVMPGMKHEQMADAYSMMDVLVLPSRTTSRWAEQFGRVLVEALSCGVPIVGSESGEIPWVIHKTGGGRLFVEGDTEMLTSVLEQLQADPDLRRSLALKGARAVAEQFSPEATARQLDEMLSSVLGGARR